MKRTILTVTLVLGLGVAGASSASAALQAPTPIPPLKVDISTKDGTKKLNVAKVVQVVTTCSANCKMTAKVAIVSRGDSLKHTFKTGLKAGVPFRPGFQLSKSGLAFLKANYKVSRFTISVVAEDVATGKTVAASRVYRFKR